MAKGIGITLVSFGHLRNGEGQSEWLPELDTLIAIIYLFHMPLFFVLGGITFSMRGGFRQFLIRKIKTLIVPYYIFSLYYLAKPFAVFVTAAWQAQHSAAASALETRIINVLFMGTGLWFLMAFFIGELLMYAVITIANRTVYCQHFITVVGLFAIIIFSIYHGVLSLPELPFQLDRGVQVLGYMCLGYAFKRTLIALTHRQGVILFLLATPLFSILAITNSLCTPAIATFESILAAVIGSTAVIGLSVAIAQNRIIASIGKNSLVYYALNNFTLNVCQLGIFRVLNINATTWPWIGQFLMGIVVTILALALLTIENAIVQRWLWWTIGKPRPVATVPAMHAESK
nr:acyltransferase family protein [Bifidobacterium thermophilum]